MTLYEALAVATFVVLVALPSLRQDTLRNLVGTCMVAVLWPAAWVAVGYYFVKVRVCGRALGRGWVREVEIVGFLLAMLLIVLAWSPALKRHVF